MVCLCAKAFKILSFTLKLLRFNPFKRKFSSFAWKRFQTKRRSIEHESSNNTHTNKWKNKTEKYTYNRIVISPRPLPPPLSLSVWYGSASYCWTSGAVFCCCSAVITRGISVFRFRKEDNNNKTLTQTHSNYNEIISCRGWCIRAYKLLAQF